MIGSLPLVVISIKFDNPSLLYKIRISNYVSSLHRRSSAEDIENQNTGDKTKESKTVKEAEATKLPVTNPLSPSDITESTLDTQNNKE